VTDKLTAALAWAARGFRVFPVLPGAKDPAVAGWLDTATTNPAEITAWWKDPLTGWSQPFNIGVLTNDMIVVDVDDKNGKDGTRSLIELDLPLDTLIVRTPTGGRHVYYTGPNKSLSVNRLGEGLDIRSFHGYVLAPGSSTPAGDYTIDTDLPLLQAPDFLVARLDEPRERRSAVALVDLDHPAALSRAADFAATCAPAVFGQGADAYTFGIACTIRDFGVSQHECFALLAEHYLPRCVAPRSPADQIAFLERKVDNAYSYGKSSPGATSAELDFAGVDITPPEAPTRPGRKWFLHGDTYDPPAWLFHEAVLQVGVGILLAPPSSGKTFLTMDLARALAQQETFFGIEANDAGGTALLLGEGSGGARMRVNALKAVGRLPIAITEVSLLNGKLDELLTDLRALSASMVEEYGVPLRLVVLDTLAASGLLLDENDNVQAATAIKALSNLSRLLNAFVLVVHHPSKDGKSERGASALRGGADVTLEIHRDGKSQVRTLAVVKSRDGPEFPLGDFTLNVVEVGKDARGRILKTCVVSTAPAKHAAAEVERPKYTDLFLECLSWAMDDEGETIEGKNVVELEAVKAAFKERKDGSRDRTAISKAWATTLAYVRELGVVREVPFGGRRYLEKLAL
jgi:hypothetical protein